MERGEIANELSSIYGVTMVAKYDVTAEHLFPGNSSH